MKTQVDKKQQSLRHTRPKEDETSETSEALSISNRTSGQSPMREDVSLNQSQQTNHRTETLN